MPPAIARLARHVGATLGITAALLVAPACERSTPTPGQKDTVVPIVPPPETSVVVTPPPSTWDSSAGPALFVAGATPSEAVVVIPGYSDTTLLDTARLDVSRVRSVRIDLFAPGRLLGTARVTRVSLPPQADSCRNGWPRARLSPVASGALPAWNVGFETGHAAEVAVDSIEGLVTADSARLAADIARLASALPGDTAAIFRGLPFVVTKAWRSRSLPNGEVLAAIVVRNVNQEANPRQERLLVVAERDSGASGARYTPVYSERIAGPEEAIETTDLLAMVLLGAERRATIVVARDVANGSSYALIERSGGQWRRRWVSTYAGC